MQKPQLVQSRRAKKLGRTPDAADGKEFVIESPLVHRESKERPNYSESKILKNGTPKSETAAHSAPPKSKSVKFSDPSATTSCTSPGLAPGRLDFDLTTTPSSITSEKRMQDRKKLANSGGKYTPIRSTPGPSSKYSIAAPPRSNNTIVHFYFFLGVLTFLLVIIGDPWFISLYKYMSQETYVPVVAVFGDAMLPTGRFRDSRYFNIDIISPQDNQIVISPSMKWSVDGVVLGGTNDVSRVFYVHATLDGVPIIFPQGNSMTIKLNGQFDMTVDLAHYGLKTTGAHQVTLEMLISELFSHILMMIS
jgi:hypothetical protein